MSKVNRFVNKVKAILTGDKAELTAIRNAETAEQAIKLQISKLEYEGVSRNVKVDKAKERLETTKYQTTPIEDGEAWYRLVAVAEENLKQANADVAEVNRSVDYARALLAEITAAE